jgi:hypothetical protein
MWVRTTVAVGGIWVGGTVGVASSPAIGINGACSTVGVTGVVSDGLQAGSVINSTASTSMSAWIVFDCMIFSLFRK